MKKYQSFFFYFLTCFSFLSVSSCKKDEEVDTDYSAATDAYYAELVFDDAAAISDEAAYETSPYDGILSSSCAVVTWDSVNTTDDDTITINFGGGCSGVDNVSRKGKLIITYLGNYSDSAVSHKITFSNYYFNDDRLNGSYTIVNNGHDSISGHKKLTGTSNGSVTLSSGSQMNWACVNTYEMYQGESTASITDDLYYINGDSHGSQATGRPFLSHISTPLVQNLSNICRRYYPSGTMQVKPNDLDIRTIDFGIGACDNVASVALGATIYTVTLR